MTVLRLLLFGWGILFLEISISNSGMGDLKRLFQTEVPIHKLAPIDELVEFILAEVMGTSPGSDALANNLLLSSF